MQFGSNRKWTRITALGLAGGALLQLGGCASDLTLILAEYALTALPELISALIGGATAA